MSLIMYYEVPAEGNNRKEVKRKFENFMGNQVYLQRNFY
jgi:CRISPR/Cas system-associated protein endoribonuclease Cas2